LREKLGGAQGGTDRQEILMQRLMVESRNAPDRIQAVKEMLAKLSPQARQRALANIEAMLFINEDAPTEWRSMMEGLRGQVIRPDRLIERRLENIPLLDAPLEGSTTSTPLDRPTSTEPLLPILKQPILDVTKSPTQPTPTQSSPTVTTPPSTTTTVSVRLSLVASPSVGVPDQAITLTVYKIVDGQRTDVSGSANITFTPSNATLQGRSFTPHDVGTYSLTAIYTDPIHGRLTAYLDFKVGPAIDVGPASDSAVIIQ
jgi:hypothetical protein